MHNGWKLYYFLIKNLELKKNVIFRNKKSNVFDWLFIFMISNNPIVFGILIYI